MLPPCIKSRRRSALRTNTRSTTGRVSLAGRSMTGWTFGSASECAAPATQASARIGTKVLKVIMFRFDTGTGSGDYRHTPQRPACAPVTAPRGPILEGIARRSAPAPHLLHPRHHDLGAGVQVGEIHIRVVLLHQPHGHLRRVLSEGPQRVTGPRNVDLGAHDAVRGEIGGLQLSVILATARFERLARHLPEIQLDALADEHRAAKLDAIDLAHVLRAYAKPVGVMPQRLVPGHPDRVVVPDAVVVRIGALLGTRHRSERRAQ